MRPPALLDKTGLAAADYQDGARRVTVAEQLATNERMSALGGKRTLLPLASTATYGRMLRDPVKLVARHVPLEASGGVTLETVRFIAETGVDFISVGRITQSAPAVDVGLDYSYA